MCPNCHRLSKDDDFCSHCGSAVYEDNTDFSIDCSDIPGHTHEKQSFTQSDQSASQYYREPRQNNSAKPKKKANGCLVVIIFVIAINVLFDIIASLIDKLW